MGGKRHKGVGMNRANKKKRAPPAPQQNESPIMHDECRASQQPPESVPEPHHVSEVSAAVAEVTGAAQDEGSSNQSALEPVQILEGLYAAVSRAEHHLDVMQRSWEKTKATYDDKENHSLFTCESVVKRDDERCLHADTQLGEARAQLVWHTQRLRRHTTFFTLARRHLKRPDDLVLKAFCDRAFRRVMTVPPVPSWKSMWPGFEAKTIWDWNANSYGLAISRGLTHVDCL